MIPKTFMSLLAACVRFLFCFSIGSEVNTENSKEESHNNNPYNETQLSFCYKVFHTFHRAVALLLSLSSNHDAALVLWSLVFFVFVHHLFLNSWWGFVSLCLAKYRMWDTPMARWLLLLLLFGFVRWCLFIICHSWRHL